MLLLFRGFLIVCFDISLHCIFSKLYIFVVFTHFHIFFNQKADMLDLKRVFSVCTIASAPKETRPCCAAFMCCCTFLYQVVTCVVVK